MLTPVPQPHWQTKHNANGARMKSCTTPVLLTTLPVSVCVCRDWMFVCMLAWFACVHGWRVCVCACVCVCLAIYAV